MTSKIKQYLFDHSPHLREEWDYEKNNVDPETMGAFSNSKAWWICLPWKHSWESTLGNRSAGRGCPVCTNKKVLIGFNDLFTVRPDLVAELQDKAQALQVTVSSGRTLLWRCDAGHEWCSSVALRSRPKGGGCPYCAGRRAIRGVTDLKTKRPDLFVQLYEKSLSLTEFSHAKVKWICPEKHVWDATVASRSAGNGCPFCSGRNPISGETDLQTARPDLYVELQDKTLSLSEFSGRRVGWVCHLDHQWIASVCDRSKSGTGCPYCSGNKVLAGYNDIKTTRPELYTELLDKSLLLSQFSGRKVTWQCKEGHLWKATVASRSNGHGCPKCCLKGTSKIESRLRSLCSAIGVVVSEDHTCRLPVPFRKNQSMSVDIYIETADAKIVCEYDGAYFHNKPSSVSRDTEKTLALLAAGYLVIRVRENSLPMLPTEHEDLLQISVPYSLEDNNIVGAVFQIKEWVESKTIEKATENVDNSAVVGYA